MGKMKNHIYGWLEDYGVMPQNLRIWIGWQAIILMLSHIGKQKKKEMSNGKSNRGR